MIHWIVGLVGMLMMGFSYTYLDPSSTLGTFLGMTGLVLCVSPFYVDYYIDYKFAKVNGGEKD